MTKYAIILIGGATLFFIEMAVAVERYITGR